VWLPIGLHYGWSLFQGPIWGATSSGLHHDQGLFRYLPAEPTILSGGDFGPEASLIATCVCIAVSAALLNIAQAVYRHYA
jgi:hypothetical protein